MNKVLCVGIILKNKNSEYLLQLRDDKKNIPYPNKWNFFGGRIEDDERPEAAIVREIKEEIGFDLKNYKFYKIFDDGGFRTYLFEGEIDVPISKLKLTEGQNFKFFKEQEVLRLDLAFGYNGVFREYLRTKQ